MKRILVGLGGPDYTVAAINQAVSLAMAHDAELTGVGVIDLLRCNYGPSRRLESSASTMGKDLRDSCWLTPLSIVGFMALRWKLNVSPDRQKNTFLLFFPQCFR